MNNHSTGTAQEERGCLFQLDAIPFPCIIFDKTRNIIDVNTEALMLFGAADKQAYSDNFTKYITACYADKDNWQLKEQQLVKQALETGHASSEWALKIHTGKIISVWVMLTRMTYNGETAVAACLKDKQEDEANERAHIMLDAMPLCANFWDENYHNIDCNQEAVQLFELSDKNEYLKRFFELSPQFQPDGRPSKEKAIEYIQRAFETGRFGFEWMHQKLNGEPIPSEITLVRVSYGRKYFVIGFTRDLRELKSTHSKLKQFERLASTDNLTGVYNRRYFYESAAELLNDLLAYKRPFSVVMFDFDYFKNINDVYGHTMGDEVLKAVAERVKLALRPDDVFARFGGDEFSILLRNTGLKEAEKVAWRLQEAVSSTPFLLLGKEVRQTISLGVAENRDGSPLEQTIQLADEALYRAKQSGRNTVRVFAFPEQENL